ncbi:unnamed protein product [Diabrotica balteata]|uniref:proton-translocating NAD(P)(+) transhydrogenase n=1 Tax=Diabrotica balteata TaxID=107213 RepID=A0A9N9X9X3_DIABA|nr:unnamed protein product [Diabrotica balteata]
MAKGILSLHYSRKQINNVTYLLTNWQKVQKAKSYTEHAGKRYFSTGKRSNKEATEVKGTPYNKLTIGVPKEVWKNEKRVSITPAVAHTLTKKGFTVNIEEDAGILSKFRNKDYEHAGAKIVDNQNVFATDIILKVRQPLDPEVIKFRENSTLISFLYPGLNKDLVNNLAERKISAFGKYIFSYF